MSYFFNVPSQLTMTVIGGVVVSPTGRLTRNRPSGAGAQLYDAAKTKGVERE